MMRRSFVIHRGSLPLPPSLVAARAMVAVPLQSGHFASSSSMMTRLHLGRSAALFSSAFVANPQPSYVTSYRYASSSSQTSSSAPAHEEEEPKSSVREALLFMLPYLWPKGRPDHKLRIVASLAFVLGAKLFLIAVPLYFKAIIDALVANNAKAAVASAGADPVVQTAAIQFCTDTAALTFGTGAFALVFAYGLTRALGSFMSEARTAIFARVSSDAYTNVSELIFLKMHALELDFHLAKKTGGVTKILDRGAKGVTTMAWCLMFVVFPTGFEMGLVCMLLQQEVGIEFVGVAVSAIVTYVVWTTKVTNWRTKYRDAYNDAETKSGSMVVDSLLNYETVKYFGNERFEAARLRSANENMNHYVVKLEQSMSVLNFGQQMIFITAATTSLYFASTGVLAGTMTVGDLVLIDSLLLQLYTPLSWLGMIYREIMTSTQNMQAMLGLLNRPIKVVDKPEVAEFKFIDGTIEFRDACFSYGDKKVLNHVNLIIPGGSTVAFVGPSGTGKTTIFRLLFRFFNLNSGTILVDGQEIDKVSMASLRKHFGVIPQDTVMFNDTVRFNIEYGSLGATQEQIEDVARKAAVHDSITRLTDGYETVVGERGLKLSGGEKQRVAIARVFLQNPDIVLADEATSALDTQTEAHVIDTLRQKGGSRRTIVMIAHRLATVKNCDTIFVLNNQGQIAERGSHYDLISKGGLYASLWNQQLLARHHNVSTVAEPSLASGSIPVKEGGAPTTTSG